MRDRNVILDRIRSNHAYSESEFFIPICVLDRVRDIAGMVAYIIFVRKNTGRAQVPTVFSEEMDG